MGYHHHLLGSRGQKICFSALVTLAGRNNPTSTEARISLTDTS